MATDERIDTAELAQRHFAQQQALGRVERIAKAVDEMQADLLEAMREAHGLGCPAEWIGLRAGLSRATVFRKLA